MDRNRKILISILSLVVVSTVIAIVDISLKMQKIQSKPSLSVSMPSFGPGVGIVRVDGPITFSQQSGFGRTRGAEAVIRRLNELEYDDNIRAIVLRINSPGGTVQFPSASSCCCCSASRGCTAGTTACNGYSNTDLSHELVGSRRIRRSLTTNSSARRSSRTTAST